MLNILFIAIAAEELPREAGERYRYGVSVLFCEAMFPKTELQNCIIHQLRNSSKYVSYKDFKALMANLKAVYAVADKPSALAAPDAFSERWDKKYPEISRSSGKTGLTSAPTSNSLRRSGG